MAFKTGAPVAPSWIATLEAAAEWGCKPWELDPEDSDVFWWYRWLAFREAKIKAEKSVQKELNGPSSRD